jgi:hypothetical protein
VTLYGLIASLAWALVALVALLRIETILLARQPKPAASLEPPPPLPPDLTSFVAAFSSEWARADALKVIRERYELTHDWNAVRRAVGLGVI